MLTKKIMTKPSLNLTILRICQNCNKPFQASKYNVAKGYGKYCSRPCRNTGAKLGFKKGHGRLMALERYKVVGEKISKVKKGVSFTEAHKKALSESQIRRFSKTKRVKCSDREIRRKCQECVSWRKAVFQRDNFTCQHCGARGVYIEAHHIKSWKNFPALRHKLSNGLTLCRPCHSKTPNYKRKNNDFNT